jgi:hypothetical protein
VVVVMGEGGGGIAPVSPRIGSYGPQQRSPTAQRCYDGATMVI